MLKLQEPRKKYKGRNIYHTGYGRWRAAKVEGNRVKYIGASTETELKMEIDSYTGRR